MMIKLEISTILMIFQFFFFGKSFVLERFILINSEVFAVKIDYRVISRIFFRLKCFSIENEKYKNCKYSEMLKTVSRRFFRNLSKTIRNSIKTLG